MANVSLDASIRTCKIDTAYASKVFSDRFLNPGNMVCPIWTGYDSAGRPVCPDSYMTKRAGCASALDRVGVENYQRPQYVEYVNLSAGGIDGEFYGENPGYSMNQWDTMRRNQRLYQINNVTGNFGQQFGSTVNPSCGVEQYNRALSQDASALRKYTAFNQGYKSNYYKSIGGQC
jgi:hypothetical protein